jgi:hypothetical protein
MEVFDIFLGWPRQYNYWDRKKGRWHRVGGSYVARREAEELFRRGVPFGVIKCFGEMGECLQADVFTIEIDAPCEGIQSGRDRLRCVADHSRDAVEVVEDMRPIIYWNGGKSLYIIFPFDYPVPAAEYAPRSWVSWMSEVFPSVDRTQLSFNTTFRMPLTPHPKFKHRGEFLDESLKPASFYIRRVPPIYVVERAGYNLVALQTQTVATEIKLAKGHKEETKQLPRWVAALVEHLRQTGGLCHAARVAVVRWLYFTGHSREEIIELFKASADFDEKKTAYHVDYEIRRMGEECRVWQVEKCREKPWRCATVARMCGGERVPPNLAELCSKAAAPVATA